MRILSSPFSFRGESFLGKIYRPYAQFLISSDKINEWIPIEMIIDTGADYSLFPKRYSELLDVDLERDCFSQATYGVGGKEGIFLYKKRIWIKTEKWKERIPVGFLSRNDVPPLLGRLKCLEDLILIMRDCRTILETMNRFNTK